MDAVDGDPCHSNLTPPAAVEPGPLDEPPPLDCSPLKSLSPALHSLLLAGTPLTAKRDELELAEVSYLDTETLPLTLEAAAAPVANPAVASTAVNCSVLLGYLQKSEEQPEPTGGSLTPVRRLSHAESDADDPGEPVAVAAAVSLPPLPDLSRTCLVCGVVAERGRSRSLRAAEPLPASGTAYLSFVGSLLEAELEAGALDRLEVVCLDCHDLLVTIDDMDQRAAAMRNSVRSQFRAWWRAGGDGAAAAVGTPEKTRRSSRRAAAARLPLPLDTVDPAEPDQTADDEYRPNKRRKARTANNSKSGLRRAKPSVMTEKKIEKSKNLVCTHCPFYTFDRDALRTHIASVHDGEKAHHCEVCQKRFAYEDSLKRHMNQHQHFIKEFRCEPCGEQFVNRSELLLHRQLYLHGAQGSPPPPPSVAADTASVDVGDFAIQFTCPDCTLLHTMRDNEKDQVLVCGCGRQFDLAAALRLFPGKYGGSCLACRRECGDHDSMESHLTEAHGTGEVVCVLCGCCYSQLDHFKLHALFHSTLEEHACQQLQCAYRTFNPVQLAAHDHPTPAGASFSEAIVAAVRSNPLGKRGRPRKDTQPVPAATVCPICGKELISLTNLKNHMVLHSDVHAHKCPVCGRRFKLRKYLNNHLTLHTGVRQFKCSMCEKDFNQKCELNRHLRYHNGDMKHVCEFCGKRFREANGLKFHRQVHTGERPFACDQCGIALRSAAKLRIHQRKHTGEKPYKCEYCGKDFAYKYNFDCHLRLHTGERRFRCSVCQTGFERRDKLNAHEQSCASRMEALAATTATDAVTPPVAAALQPVPLQLPLQSLQQQQPLLPPPAPPPPQGQQQQQQQAEPQLYSWPMDELQSQ